MEGDEEQVTVDYANDLDTGMCVARSSEMRPHARGCSCGSPRRRSYGSGFPRSGDALDCGWNLNRLNDNPENVLRAIGSCLPGVTRCALAP